MEQIPRGNPLITKFIDLVNSKIGSKVLLNNINYKNLSIEQIWNTNKSIILFGNSPLEGSSFFNMASTNISNPWPNTTSIDEIKRLNKEYLEKRRSGEKYTNTLFVSQFIPTPATFTKDLMTKSKTWVKSMWNNTNSSGQSSPLCPNIVMVDWFPVEPKYSLTDIARRPRICP